MNKKILIISHFIAPLASIASVRWTKLSKYLKKQHGDEVSISILTDKKEFDTFQSYDETLAKDLIFFDEVFEIPHPIFTSCIYRMRKLLKKETANSNDQVYQKAISSLLTKAYLEFRNLLLTQKAKTLLRKLPIKEYDIVISSCGPLWPHAVAHYIKKHNPKVKWLADYRDMAVDELDPLIIRKWNQYQSRKYTQNADLILKVQDDLNVDAASQVPEEIITNGYDSEEMSTSKKPPVFSIVFTGSLGHASNTDFSVIFHAIKDIINYYQLEKSDFNVIYAGANGATAELYAKDSEDIFTNKYLLPREEAIKLQRSSAILLQAGITTKKLRTFWTGKMYEYMTAQKPIVYIMNGNISNSLTNEYINKLDGYCYEACRHKQTYDGLKEYIYTKYLEWKKTGDVSVQQDLDYINSFSYANIAKKLWKIIERV